MSPRRGPNEGSISQRSDGRWQVRVDLGRDELGKRRRKYLYADTQAEAVKLLQRAQRDKVRGQLAAGRRDAPRTVGAWLDEWLPTVRATREPGTYIHYETDVRLHLKPALGHIRLAQLGPADIERFLLAKLEAGSPPSSVARLKAVLSSALSKAVRMDIIGRNAAAGRLIDLPRQDRHRAQQAMTLEQAKAFVASVRTDRLHALYLLAVVLGQRQGEMLGLRWSDVDFDGGRLRLLYKLTRVGGEWQLRRPKTSGSRHTLPLLAPVAAALRERRIRQEWERQVAGSSWSEFEHDGRPVGLVFTTSNGAPIHHQELLRAFYGCLKMAGLPRIRFHDLRHSAASIMLALGVPLKTVSTVLGHSGIRMTADTYGHLTEAVLRSQLADVDAAWTEDEPADPAKEAR